MEGLPQHRAPNKNVWQYWRRALDTLVALAVLTANAGMMIMMMLQEAHANQSSSEQSAPIVAEVTVFSGVLMTLSIEYSKTVMEMMVTLFFTSMFSSVRLCFGLGRVCVAYLLRRCLASRVD